MPLLDPNKNEEEKSFINRCINMESVKKEFPNQKQRVGVCFSQWKKNKKKDSVDKVERSFVFHLDYSKKSDFKIDKVTGFLHAKARLTRTGVFDYYDDDGNLWREHRSDEEVFDDESIKSLELKPITNEHPDQFVTVNNIKSLQIGIVGEKIIKDGIYLLGNIVITDKDMVITIVNRKKADLNTELSCGYSCKVIPDTGIHNKDGYYTLKQQEIRYNHVGVVNETRAGHNVKILDVKQNGNNNNKGKEIVMPDKIQFSRKAIDLGTFKMDSITEIVDEDSLKLINIISNKLDEAIAVIETIQNKKLALQGKFDQANETINTLKKDVENLSNINSPRVVKMIKTRMDVEKIAAALDVDCNGKDFKTIKCDCIKKVSEKADLKDKPDAYIDARYDSIVEIVTEKNKNNGNDKFFQFMKNANDGKNKDTSNPRENFINKDKKENRK